MFLELRQLIHYYLNLLSGSLTLVAMVNKAVNQSLNVMEAHDYKDQSSIFVEYLEANAN